MSAFPPGAILFQHKHSLQFPTVAHRPFSTVAIVLTCQDPAPIEPTPPTSCLLDAVVDLDVLSLDKLFAVSEWLPHDCLMTRPSLDSCLHGQGDAEAQSASFLVAPGVQRCSIIVVIPISDCPWCLRGIGLIFPAPHEGEIFHHVDTLRAHLDHPGVLHHLPRARPAVWLLLQTTPISSCS